MVVTLVSEGLIAVTVDLSKVELAIIKASLNFTVEISCAGSVRGTITRARTNGKEGM